MPRSDSRSDMAGASLRDEEETSAAANSPMMENCSERPSAVAELTDGDGAELRIRLAESFTFDRARQPRRPPQRRG